MYWCKWVVGLTRERKRESEENRDKPIKLSHWKMEGSERENR